MAIKVIIKAILTAIGIAALLLLLAFLVFLAIQNPWLWLVYVVALLLAILS